MPGSKKNERLILLVNDILDMEKIASGKMNFNFQDVAAGTLLQQSLEANRAYAEQFNVSFQLETDHDLPHIRVDVDRFMQVLANLLSNAAKFSPAGSIISISAQRQQQRVRISVHDSGPGIAEEFQHKIFQKFSQADSSDTRTKGGTGLGLSISKAIVENMNAKISFESSAETGTTFFVDFPCGTVADEAHEYSAPGLRPPRTQEKPVILHVEDDPDICQVLLTLVGNTATVLSTHTISAAKVALLSQHIDLVILDLGLPDGEGRELLAIIKRHQLHVPVIIFSALEISVRIDGNVKAALVKSRTSNEQLLAQIKQTISR